MKAKKVFEFQRNKDITKSLDIGSMWAPFKRGDMIKVKENIYLDNKHSFSLLQGNLLLNIGTKLLYTDNEFTAIGGLNPGYWIALNWVLNHKNSFERI